MFLWRYSSVGQSARFTCERSWVRAPLSPPLERKAIRQYNEKRLALQVFFIASSKTRPAVSHKPTADAPGKFPANAAPSIPTRALFEKTTDPTFPALPQADGGNTPPKTETAMGTAKSSPPNKNQRQGIPDTLSANSCTAPPAYGKAAGPQTPDIRH